LGRRLRANELSGIARRGRSFYREDVPGGRSLSSNQCREESAVPSELQSVNRMIIINNDGNPWLTGAGAVSKDKKAPSAQLGDAMGLGRIRFISTRVNHILRVTKPNTERATNICPNSLSQIGAYGLHYNYMYIDSYR
jgi:hypothetical protein